MTNTTHQAAHDCPAAHSMDTTWFAVDSEGFVGVFETDEHGALPDAALVNAYDEEPFGLWPVESILAARALLNGSFPEPLGEPFRETFDENVIAVLRPDSEDGRGTYRDAAGCSYPAQRRLGAETLVLNDREPRIAASLQPLSPQAIAALRLAPGVERVVTSEEIRVWSEEDHTPDGVYRYHARDYDRPAHYSRDGEVADALVADDLPDDVAGRLRGLEFPVRFADSQAIDLADHLRDDEYSAWGDYEVSGQEKERTPWSVYLFAVLVVLVVIAVIRYAL